jgi:hypothetical protein
LRMSFEEGTVKRLAWGGDLEEELSAIHAQPTPQERTGRLPEVSIKSASEARHHDCHMLDCPLQKREI